MVSSASPAQFSNTAPGRAPSHDQSLREIRPHRLDRGPELVDMQQSVTSASFDQLVDPIYYPFSSIDDVKISVRHDCRFARHRLWRFIRFTRSLHFPRIVLLAKRCVL